MRVRLTLDVGAFERYVIGQYFATEQDPARPRATRLQVRRFAMAALRSAARDYAEDQLVGRPRATAARLLKADPDGDRRERLAPLAERQPMLW